MHKHTLQLLNGILIGVHSLLAGAPASAAAGAGSTRQHGGAGPSGIESMDLADDDMAAVAAAVGQEPGSDVSSFHRRQQEELLAMYQRQAAQQHPAALQHPAAAAAADAFADLDAEQQGLAAVGVALPRGGAAAAAVDEPLDLPAGINLEEARMLEAAMLGIPYAGRLPDFSAAPAAATPLSPGTLEQHAIRREQDQAYEESLALDR